MDEIIPGRADRFLAELSFIELIVVALGRIPRALREAAPYMLFGLLVACSLDYWSYKLRPLPSATLATSGAQSGTEPAVRPRPSRERGNESVFGELLGELATGFFVSTIAVFFYEWGSHAKAALHVSDKLGNLLYSIGHERIELGIRDAFPNWKTLHEDHKRFVEALANLDSPENSGRVADVEFLTLFVHHAAAYGSQLETLRTHLKNPDADVGRPFHLDFSKLEYADAILYHWMGRLKARDRYITFSNPRTWSALKGDRFRDANREAVERGARVRRILIMGRDDDKHEPEDLWKLIDHYKFAANPRAQKKGTYRIQIATPAVFEPKQIKTDSWHYGVFMADSAIAGAAEDRAFVAFKVLEAEVADFELVAVKETDDLVKNFEDIWTILETSAEGPIIPKDRHPSAQGAGRFIDAVMSREIALLLEEDNTRLYKKRLREQIDNLQITAQSLAESKPHITIEILSTLDSLKSHYKLPKFYKAIEPITVRHVLLLDDDGDKTRRAAAKSLASWKEEGFPSTADVLAIFRNDDVAVRSRWLKPHWRILADGKPLHDYVFTLNCKNDLSDFFLTSTPSARMEVEAYASNFKWACGRATPYRWVGDQLLAVSGPTKSNVDDYEGNAS